jgi:hypothetical protein
LWLHVYPHGQLVPPHGKGAQSHEPPWHVVPLAQTIPQPPQLPLSTSVFVQTDPHCSSGSGPHTHWPLTHVVPGAHEPEHATV